MVQTGRGGGSKYVTEGGGVIKKKSKILNGGLLYGPSCKILKMMGIKIFVMYQI
eukprot:UN03629